MLEAHGRHETITDARAGKTTFVYNDADQVVSVISPAPEPGLDPQVTSNDYDSMGRLWKTTFPDGASVTNEFFPTGLISKKSGAREYPAAFAYDAQGRMTGMTTQPDDPARAAVTTWNYDPFRGSLASKLYEGNVPGPIYTNTAAGKLSFRGWARGTNTSYAYNRLGDLATVAYNDGSPSVTSGYDRRGRLISTTRGSEVIRRSFDDAGNLLGETYSGGPLNGLTVTNMYDQLLRRTNVALLNGAGSVLASTTYAYDAASRLSMVANGANIAAYNYVANSDLIDRVSLTNSGALRMTTSRTYDFLNRLKRIESLDAQSAPVSSFTYAYNQANQRTSVTMADGSSWAFGYDDLGQVTSGARRWSDGSEVVGQQFGYSFDQIGNRLFTLSAGHTAAYTNNSLNQITSRDVPGSVSILGEANSNATVTLWADNGAWAYTSRHGDYFAGELPVTNDAAPVWLTVTNLAVLQDGNNPDFISTEIGHALLPATPEQFQYDPDGNLIVDGNWIYTWDAENRLVAMTNVASIPDAAKKALVFTYDYSGRRIQKDVFTWNPATLNYELSTRSKFLYDGWNLIAVLDGNNDPLLSFTWGTDLSGSLRGAGGVGGLLSVTVHTGSNAGTYFYCYDGNGNVVALVNAADGSVVSRYEYAPFGELLRATGPMAKANPFRFSTKYQDDETDLLYYGYRYEKDGRWLSRDPLGERGGQNLYSLTGNQAVSRIDYLGLADFLFRQAEGKRRAIGDIGRVTQPDGFGGMNLLVAGWSATSSVWARMNSTITYCCNTVVPEEELAKPTGSPHTESGSLILLLTDADPGTYTITIRATATAAAFSPTRSRSGALVKVTRADRPLSENLVLHGGATANKNHFTDSKTFQVTVNVASKRQEIYLADFIPTLGTTCGSAAAVGTLSVLSYVGPDGLEKKAPTQQNPFE